MCGLVSVVTKHRNGLSKEQCEIFDTLLFVDQLRGADSTGSFVVDNSGNLDLAKEATNATVFRTKTEYKDLLSNALRKGSAIVGHNRAATKGIINDANAHPFVVDDRITLVHNGTLWGDHKKLADTEVDSHAIAHTIHNHGDDVEAALKELTGAYALIWHDFKNQSLNFVRNSQRPLHWVEVPGAWLWASEANMLVWMLDRFNLKAMSDVSLLPESTLITYNMVNGGWEIATKKLQLTPPPVVHSYKPPAYTNPCGYDDEEYAHWYGGGQDAYVRPVTPVVPINQRANQTRIDSIEEDLAHKFDSHYTWNEFQSSTAPIRENSYHPIKCLECTEVAVSGPSLGYFIYGVLENEPDIMVKIHLAAGHKTEMEVLDMCVNERRYLTNLKTRKWTMYRELSRKTSPQDGFGMYICEGIKEIVPAEIC